MLVYPLPPLVIVPVKPGIVIVALAALKPESEEFAPPVNWTPV